jgi:hypothetical protein
MTAPKKPTPKKPKVAKHPTTVAVLVARIEQLELAFEDTAKTVSMQQEDIEAVANFVASKAASAIAPEPATVDLRSIGRGHTFSDPNTGVSYIRVVPVGQLLNSTLISDVVGRGDCLAVCVKTGNLQLVPGHRQVLAKASYDNSAFI